MYLNLFTYTHTVTLKISASHIASTTTMYEKPTLEVIAWILRKDGLSHTIGRAFFQSPGRWTQALNKTACGQGLNELGFLYCSFASDTTVNVAVETSPSSYVTVWVKVSTPSKGTSNVERMWLSNTSTSPYSGGLSISTTTDPSPNPMSLTNTPMSTSSTHSSVTLSSSHSLYRRSD